MKILSLFFLLFFTSLTHAQTTSKGLISNYFGTWRIVRFENASLENPSHVYVTEEKARLQIGRQLNMTSAMATLDQGLIGAAQKTCISPKYDLISTDAFLNPSEQFLLPDEHPSKRPAELRFFEVFCGDELLIGFEVSKDEWLSVFYDGYFFFFSKVQ